MHRTSKSRRNDMHLDSDRGTGSLDTTRAILAKIRCAACTKSYLVPLSGSWLWANRPSELRYDFNGI